MRASDSMIIKTNDHQIQKVHMKQTAYVKTRSNNDEIQAGLIAFTRQHVDILLKREFTPKPPKIQRLYV
ncbi:hypothetical protein BWP24_21080 [Vibrio campbellii]|nr:hypothetical protein BWP24_21080 [Vibrio campbellii]